MMPTATAMNGPDIASVAMPVPSAKGPSFSVSGGAGLSLFDTAGHHRLSVQAPRLTSDSRISPGIIACGRRPDPLTLSIAEPRATAVPPSMAAHRVR